MLDYSLQIDQFFRMHWLLLQAYVAYIEAHSNRTLCNKSLLLCSLIMAALRSRCRHYIFVLFLSFSLSFFFPHLVSAVAEWMSTILLHMVWS